MIESSSHIARFYDSRAEDYEDAFAAQPFQARARDFLTRKVQDNMRVLDLGCGPGHLTADLPDAVHVVGTDISPEMVRKAKAKRASGQYLVNDYLDPLPPGLTDFDLILANGCFDLCEDIEKVLCLTSKQLNEGGIFYFTVLERRSDIPHQSTEKMNARPDQPFPIWFYLYSFQKIVSALGRANLSPIRYEYAAGCKSRTLGLDFFYGYWLVTRTK